jgi:hypothetical protein
VASVVPGERPTTQAIVAAVSFHRSMKLIDEIRLVERNPTVCFCLKRSSKDSILFAGCVRCVQVLEWKNNKFSLLMIALDIHTGKKGV